MSGGYRVDLTALRQAAEGVDDVLGRLAEKKVGDIAPDTSSLGHEALGSVVSDFCDRWQRGVDNLATDAQQIASRLTHNVYAYEHVEQTVKGTFDGILGSSSGPDPAAR